MFDANLGPAGYRSGRCAVPPTSAEAHVTHTVNRIMRGAGLRCMTIAGILGMALSVLTGLGVSAAQDDRSVDTAAATPAVYEGVETYGRFLGEPDAPVQLVIYGDFQCPHCKNFDDRDFPPIIENFVKTGEVRVEWRPLPIISGNADIPLGSADNESVQTAEGAMCAADQDQFWPYSEALYAAQGNPNSGVFADQMLKRTAEELDLDMEAFNECLDSGEKQDDVIAFREEAVELGATGTPTFLIDDQLVSYTQRGYDRLEEQINAALDGEPVNN